MARPARAIVIHPEDNVATALEPIPAGGRATAARDGKRQTVKVTDEIPTGHKFSLGPIARGEAVIKYGESIGRATADIPPGRHVHTHNLESERGRGDRPEL